MDTWLCEISVSKNANRIKYLVNCKYLDKAWFRVILQLLNLLRFNISKSISLKVLHYIINIILYMVLNNRQLQNLWIR